MWQNLRTQIVTKLNNQMLTKLELWQISISEERKKKKLQKCLLVRRFWHLDNQWDLLFALFCDSCDVLQLNWCWSAIEVQLKWHYPAYSPNIHSRLVQNGAFSKLCHHRPILGIRSLTRGLHDLQKWVFCDDSDIQAVMATLWLTRPRGPSQWKYGRNYCLFKHWLKHKWVPLQIIQSFDGLGDPGKSKVLKYLLYCVQIHSIPKMDKA